MWECMNLSKSFQSAPADAPKKKQNKDDEDDKKDPDGFQQPQNVINIIFGGDPSFSKRAQKLLLREILLVKPAIQTIKIQRGPHHILQRGSMDQLL